MRRHTFTKNRNIVQERCQIDINIHNPKTKIPKSASSAFNKGLDRSKQELGGAS